MAKRFTDSEKWKNRWFRTLPNHVRWLWLYILDNCDQCGVWKVDFDLASFMTGFPVSEEEAREQFAGKFFEVASDEWFFPGFIEFQQGESLSEGKNAHKSIISFLERNNFSLIAPFHPIVMPSRSHDDGTMVPPSKSKGHGNGIGSGQEGGLGETPDPPPTPLVTNQAKPPALPSASPRPGLNVSAEIFDRENLKACIVAWGKTLKKFKIPKDPAFDEFHIAGLMRAHGFQKTKFALIGAGFEPEGETFDPANHCSIVRLRKPEVFEKFVNLGAKNSGETITQSAGSGDAEWLAEKAKFDEETELLAEKENLMMADTEVRTNGIPEHIRAKNAGEISEEDFDRAQAFWVASHLHGYRPQFYPRMPEEVRAYITGRMNGSVTYNANTSRELGEWMHQCRKCHDENEVSKQDLDKTIATFEKLELWDELAAVRRFASSFQRIADDFGDYKRGFIVMERDQKLRASRV